MAVLAPQQTLAQLTYDYTGNEMTWLLAPPGGGDPGIVSATATFNIPSDYTGFATPASITLSATGQNYSFTSDQYTGVEYAQFDNGTITQWEIQTIGGSNGPFRQPSGRARNVPTGDLLFNGIAQTAYRQSWAGGVQGDGSWRAAPDHTVRSGFYIQRER